MTAGWCEFSSEFTSENQGHRLRCRVSRATTRLSSDRLPRAGREAVRRRRMPAGSTRSTSPRPGHEVVKAAHGRAQRHRSSASTSTRPPTALRIVSDTGQNLRQPFARPECVPPDGRQTPRSRTLPRRGCRPAPGVTGAAYTNNDLSDPATATTLFDLDTTMDQVAVQSPPALRHARSRPASLAWTRARRPDSTSTAVSCGDVTVSNHAFAALMSNGSAVPSTGSSSRPVGRFGSARSARRVIDIAIPLKQ